MTTRILLAPVIAAVVLTLVTLIVLRVLITVGYEYITKSRSTSG